MSALKWRNLSVPQRNALRQLCQAKTATVGWQRGQFSSRLAKALVEKGAALLPGHKGDLYWISSGTQIVPTDAGCAAVAAADAYLADPAAVARSRVAAPPAAVPAGPRAKSRTPAAVPAGPRAKSRTPAAVRGSTKRRTRSSS